jgi:hypothetical protein
VFCSCEQPHDLRLAAVQQGCVVTTHNQSRDHGEQRLGILSLLSQIRISTLDIARDADIEIPTSRPLDSIGNRAALTMDILIRLIAFHCLSYTFHCCLTYDPDYFRGADRFPGWEAKFRVRGRQGGCNQSARVWRWMGMLRDEPKASPAATSRRRVWPRRAEGESRPP